MIDLVPKTWSEDLRKPLTEALEAFWEEHDGDYENVDNHRFARAGDPEEVKAYVQARNSGCCGQFDEVWPFGDVLVLYGFDHGH